jgi:lipid II:glycine glycyltransferase (peptidoglycan interpeptide bridge formation enzyme)
MLTATAKRQGFAAHSLGYLETMWDVFEPSGGVALLMVERGGIAVSAVLGLGFGSTFNDKLAAWSGEAGADRPNHAAVWCAIRWAREAGYRFFDFEGIDPVGARALLDGGRLPAQLQASVTSFKAGFGGTPVIMPSAWYRIDNRMVGWAYDRYTNLKQGSRLALYLSNQIRRGRTHGNTMNAGRTRIS